MDSIFDEGAFDNGIEIDISAELEEEQCRYERENAGSIVITAIKEPKQPERTQEEQADFEISRARIAFVLGDGTEKEWRDTVAKWGRTPKN